MIDDCYYLDHFEFERFEHIDVCRVEDQEHVYLPLLMPPPLPYSLSPHVCIAQSQDLVDLLEKASLPSLPYILESFSPLPNSKHRTLHLIYRTIYT